MRLLQPCRRGSQLLRPFSLNRVQFSLPAFAGARHFSQKPSELSEKVAETLPTPDAPAKPRLEPVDTTTFMDLQQEDRFVERRIEDHVKEHGEQIPEAQDFQEAAQRLAEAPSAPVPLRLRDPNAVAEQQKDVIIRSRTTTGQVLWPATKEDIEILSQSDQLYPRPFQVEGSVIIRLVRLSDPVTSPVGRMVRNRQYGIRGNEKWQLLATGFVCMLMVFSLGAWQLRRMKWKRDLIEMRRERLAMPRLQVSGSPFPWKDQVPDYVYRVVEVRGVFDHDQEMHVGPRPGSDETGENTPGVLVVTPLRLEDGSTVLVNRGHLPSYRLDRATRKEVPTWVRVRGVLEEGEIPNLVGRYARLKNRPDKKQYLYLLADELAENANARNHEECAQALVTAIDVLYELQHVSAPGGWSSLIGGVGSEVLILTKIIRAHCPS
eukprot:s173_g31.t2